jgi:S1-C subfamily serine protease
MRSSIQWRGLTIRALHRGLYPCLLGLLAQCAGQAPVPAVPGPAEIVDKASPAVAMVLAAQSPGDTTAAVGAALVIYQDGDLLTPYHLIQNASAVQVRLKSGEVFDRVQLLGVDPRRDIAAIRITSSGLPVVPIARGATPSPGDPVESIFHPAAQAWSFSTGVVTGFRLADEVPGAGTGFRVIQFTAPAGSGLSGGVLFDAAGRALGLITGPRSGGQNVNLAVPIENVLGLADTPPTKTFSSGALLTPPTPGALPAAVPASTPVQSPAVPATSPAQTATSASDKPTPTGTPKDPDAILRSFKTMYVDAHGANYFGSDELKTSLAHNKDFASLGIHFVDEPKNADTILEVGYIALWDFPFELKQRDTSVVLLIGKGYGPLSGRAGAASVASQFIKLAKPYRTAPVEEK